jgi:holo-[acyl-carrier protein] synthase
VIGIDLIEIGRLERALERRPRLAERLFSPAELEFASARARPGRHLAARFAAKEATVKALGLRRMNQSVQHDDTPTIRGMIAKVPHVLRVNHEA